MTIATAISIRNLSPSASGRSQAIFKPNQKNPIARQTIVRSLCLATQHPTSNKHAMQSLGFCLVSPCLRTSSFINHHLAATAPESSQPCPEYRIRPHLMRVPWLVHSHRSAQVNQTRENPTLEINRSTSPALQPCCKTARHCIAFRSPLLPVLVTKLSLPLLLCTIGNHLTIKRNIYPSKNSKTTSPSPLPSTIELLHYLFPCADQMKIPKASRIELP
jgi:hypothetical protein